jgi:predicted GTPase
MEQLGMIRSKFGTIPVPGANVTLNGSDLSSKGREDKKELITKLREMLETLTYDKLIETSATRSENLMKQLQKVPIPNGRAIFMG